MPVKPLPLHEEILLLALKDEKGTIASGTWYSIALGGAILAELMLEERVEAEVEGKKTFLKRLNKKKTGDAVLDEALEKIDSAKRRAALETWVSRFSGIKQLVHRVAESLCKKKILRADERQILLFFKQRIYPERDHAPEKEILARLKSAIFTSGKNATPRTIVLLSLAHSCQILPVCFDKKKLKSRKAHIEELMKGTTLGDATQAAVQSAQAAVMVATMMPAMIAATTVAIHS